MQENELTSHRGIDACPSDSELATLLDGTLAEPRAEEVRRHILDCADCYEVYADAHRFEMEVAAAATATEAVPAANVVPFERPQQPPLPAMPAAPARRRLPQRWYAAAAGLFVVALSGYLLSRKVEAPLPQPNLELADLVSVLDGGSRGAETAIPSPRQTLRGGETEAPLDPLQARILIGKGSVDLRLGADSGNRQIVSDSKADLLRADGAITYSGQSAVRETLIQLGQQLDGLPESAPLPPDLAAALVQTADQLMKSAQTRQKDYQNLGFWTETGTLAAKAGSVAFFEAPKNRRALDWFVQDQKKKSPSIQLDRRGKVDLEKIADAWPSVGSGPDFSGLAEAFDCLQQSALGQCGISE